MTLSSSIIASLCPTLEVVTLPNFWAPNRSRVNETIGWFVCVSNLGWESIRFSPLIIIFLLTISSSPFSDKIISLPKSSSVLETNLKLSCAVFPSKFLILSGSFKPGSSTKIRFSPLWRIVGSLVPVSSILLLTISIDCFKAELFKDNSPNLEKFIFIIFLFSSNNNSWLLYWGINGLIKLSFFE